LPLRTATAICSTNCCSVRRLRPASHQRRDLLSSPHKHLVAAGREPAPRGSRARRSPRAGRVAAAGGRASQSAHRRGGRRSRLTPASEICGAAGPSRDNGLCAPRIHEKKAGRFARQSRRRAHRRRREARIWRIARPGQRRGPALLTCRTGSLSSPPSCWSVAVRVRVGGMGSCVRGRPGLLRSATRVGSWPVT
jgi:hypothetical protein